VGRSLAAGLFTCFVGFLALLWGMAPPGVTATGQLDFSSWLLPVLVGGVILLVGLRRLAGGLPPSLAATALAALVTPPLVLCMVGAWRLTFPPVLPQSMIAATPQHLPIAVLSGPPLFHLRFEGNAEELTPVSQAAPLWQVLARWFALHPLDHVAPQDLRVKAGLLVIQPRALAPAELVAIDDWVWSGGRAVILADPEFRWADNRPLGHPLRPPRKSQLDPLLRHWGLELGAPAMRPPGTDPVERHFLSDGRLLQVAGTSRFQRMDGTCRLSSGGLVAKCMIGKGNAILIADADFANDALWTLNSNRPDDPRRWTSDAVAVLADWLEPGAGAAAGRRLWLLDAAHLPHAVRIALLVLVAAAMATAIFTAKGGTKEKHRPQIPKLEPS
jgi:hypothetical protein